MDKIKDYLPLTSAFFLILGALRLIFFYGFFGIDIISYIELSEIFSLSLSFLVSSSIITIVFLIVFIPSITNEQIKQEPDKKAGAVGILLITSFMIYWMFNTYDIFEEYIVDFRVSYDSLAIFAALILVPLLIRFFLPTVKKRAYDLFSVDIHSNDLLFLIIIFNIFALCALQSRSTARNILLRKLPEYVEIKLDSITIKSAPNYRFIGKTKNYVFFYNLTTNVADSYSLDGGRKISMANSLPMLQLGGIRNVKATDKKK